MLKILLKYNDSWENSFSEGSIEDINNGPRKFIGSMSNVKKIDDYKQVEVSKQTVLGVMMRLLGDQRRLFQAKEAKDSILSLLDSCLNFEETKESITNEIVFLRNLNNADDRNSFAGPKLDEKTDLFSSKFFDIIWGPLFYTEIQLENLILNNEESNVKVLLEKDRITVANHIENLISKNKNSYGVSMKFSNKEIDSKLIKNGYISDNQSADYRTMVFSSIYLIIENILKQDPLFSNNLSKNGNISGLSKRSFTYKDFVGGSVGRKKTVTGNPSKYEIWVENPNGKKSKESFYLKRKSGKLLISLDLSKDDSRMIREQIESAGVSSITLGKKGLTYVDAIWEE